MNEPARPSRHKSAALLTLSLLLACTGGCADGGAKLDATFKRLFQPKQTPQQYMLVAVSDADPDVRREALAHLAKSKLSNRDWAIKGYVAIALLESQTQSRCIALRALAQGGDPRAAETCLKIINFRDFPPQEVRPPDDLCRWDATLGLARLSLEGHVPAESRDLVRDTLIARLRSDPNANVRVAAARGLAAYSGDETLKTLIAALHDENFAVTYEAEGALARLTGVTHDCSALEWERWYEEHKAAPFASAGQIPPSRRPAYTNKMEKAAYDANQFFRWIFPQRKVE